MAKNGLYWQALCTALLAGILISPGLRASAQSQANSPVPASTGAASGAASTPAAYDVISIRPDNSGNRSSEWRTLPDGLVYTNVPLRVFVYRAYGIITNSQVKGLPGWVESEHYDIQAKVDADTAAAWQKMTRNERENREQSMIRALLADRCQFKAHQETRELPVYDLVIAKGGLKIKKAPPNEPGSHWWNTTSTTGTLSGHATSVDTVADILSTFVGRLVVDKTGLGGQKFDFELKWTTDDQLGANNAPDAPPSLISALEEQLGLKLVPAKGPVEVLVIDRIEKPSAN